MKPVSLTSLNKIYLEDPSITEDVFNITFQIVDEVGSYVKDDTQELLKEKDAKYDNENKKYYAEFKIDPDSKGKYYRLTFDIKNAEGVFVQSDFYLTDLIVERKSSTVQLVPVPYFRNYIAESGLDSEAKERIAEYPMDAIQELLTGAMAELESETKLIFTKRTVQNEGHNWFGEGLRETWWLIQLLQRPIISVESYELWFANKKIFKIDVDPLKQYLQIMKVEGYIQFMPAVGQQFAMTYYNNLESSLMALVSIMPGTTYVPNVFRISYTYGLDFMNLDESEQTELRTAIARRAMMNSVFLVNKDIMKGSESQSADGISYSFSNNAKQWFDSETQRQKDWIFNLMRKYNTLTDIDFG